VQVVRFDSPGEVLSREVAADGSVSATADVSRCGIYEYARADGTKRRELVLPEHLFDPASLRTLGNVAVTAWPPAGHPPELLTPENTGKYAVGHVHETVDAVDATEEQDFGYVRVRLTGRTAEAVRKLSQARLFTSPGYVLPQYDPTPGTHPLWGAYDAIQGPRVYNHLALTDTPRGGDQMVVHLDSENSGDADVATQSSTQARVDTRPHQEATVTVKMRLDGVGREVSVDEVTAEILKQEFARRDADAQSATARYEVLKEELDAHKTSMDQAMTEMEKIKAEKEKLAGEQAATQAVVTDARARADAAEKRLADPKVLRELMAPRVDLETTARAVLATDQHKRIDAMTDDELRTNVVKTLLPAVKTDGVTGERLDGMYQTAVATRQVRTDSTPPARDPNAKDPQSQGGKTTAELHKARTDAEYVPPGKGRK